MKQTPLFMTVIVVVGLSSNLVVAQSRSAVQFYDTTGTAKTGKMGWSGDAATGHFFLQTPNQGELIKSTANGVEITGTVSATGFSGDGSGLTNLPSPVVSIGSVTGLLDSLNHKANSADVTALQTQSAAKPDTNWVKSRITVKADTSWVNGKLVIKSDTTWVIQKISIKADTGWVNTKIANIGTAQIPDNAVTTAKIADTAVTAAKIKDRAVIDAKIDSVSWSKVRSKPTAFPPESHTHAIANVTNLQSSLDGKASVVHSHGISQVSGLQDSISAKAALNHSHTIANVTGLQTAIDAKANTSNPTFTGNVTLSSGSGLVVNPDNTVDYRRCVTIRNGDLSCGHGFRIFTGATDGSGSEMTLLTAGDPATHSFLFMTRGSDTRAGDAVFKIYGKESGGWTHSMDLTHNGTQGIISTAAGDIDMVPATGIVKVNGVQVSTSDARFKQNIQPLKSSLKKVNALQGVSFNFRSPQYPDRKLPKGRHIGLIAQDVEKVVPEVVNTDNDGYKSLAYDHLVALLIEAVKEQQIEIEQMKKQLQRVSTEPKQ